MCSCIIALIKYGPNRVLPQGERERETLLHFAGHSGNLLAGQVPAACVAAQEAVEKGQQVGTCYFCLK